MPTATMDYQVPLDEAEALSTRERVAQALREGGRARVTVTSKATAKHLTILLNCKRRGPDNRFISRVRKEGRVGIEEADALFVDGGDTAVGEWIATLDLQTGEWREPKGWHDERGPHYAWAARHVVAWALGSFDLDAKAEVKLAAECSRCGKQLTDPVSIGRGLGPECAGHSTGASHV